MTRGTFFAALLFVCAAYADEALDAGFERDVLVLIAGDAACHRLDVYLAVSPRQHQRGLMFVRELPETTGMLFLYEDEARLSMWMKNTLIPLDIVFARADGSVSSVARDTEPLSERSISAREPVKYVLELNAGVADKLGIDRDSRLDWYRPNARR